MTLLNGSAIPGIVTTRIGSTADVSAGCPCCGVFWISMTPLGTELCLRSRYHSHSSPILLGKLFSTIFTQSAWIFPHKIDNSYPITNLSVRSFHPIAAATEVKVFPSPISSSTSAPGVSASQTHLLTMNQITKTWLPTQFVPRRPGIEWLWPTTWSSIDWRIGWGFSCLTTSSRHSWSNSLLFVLITVLHTELVLSGSRTSSPSTCSWTSLAPWLVIFSSWMISFSCVDVSWADGLILRHTWNLRRC